jgi:hypothetical protein
LKLVILQFKKDTKEQVYLQTLIEQKMTCEDIEKVIPFLYKDRILSCISNFAYSKSQIVLGDAQVAIEAGKKWLHLEE